MGDPRQDIYLLSRNAQVQEGVAEVNIKALGCLRIKTLFIHPAVSMLTDLCSCRRICALS